MCRNKLLCTMGIAGMLIALTGCSGSFKLISDTGSSKQGTIAKEDYLKTDVLKSGTDTSLGKYKTITVEKTTYTEAALSQSMERYYANIPTVNFNYENVTGEFGEYMASYMQYVNAGDVVATVNVDVDQVSIEESTIKLDRLKERYAEDKAEYEKELEQKNKELLANWGETENKLKQIELDQFKLDWENTEYHYEKDIEEAAKELEKKSKENSVIELTAPVSGYVFYDSKHKAGDEIKYGDYICHVLDSQDVYTATDSQADRFAYGMEFDFNVGQKKYTGKVVSGGTWGLFGNLDTNETIFKIGSGEEVITDNGRSNYILNGNLVSLEDVCVIPKEAVTVESTGYYVTVLNDDGTMTKTQFIPGGNNSEEYWVLDGIEEGTVICIK